MISPESKVQAPLWTDYGPNLRRLAEPYPAPAGTPCTAPNTRVDARSRLPGTGVSRTSTCARAPGGGSARRGPRAGPGLPAHAADRRAGVPRRAGPAALRAVPGARSRAAPALADRAPTRVRAHHAPDRSSRGVEPTQGPRT